MDEERKEIRLNGQVKTLEVCPHITINGEKSNNDDNGCEYTEQLDIYCKICKKTFKFDILIN